MPDDITQALLQKPPQTSISPSVPKKRVLPFNDWARTFDPMMPKDEYNKQRDFYFDKYVAPHYKNDADRAAGQEKFNSLTERKPLLTLGEKAALPFSLASHEFFASAESSKLFGGTLKALLTDKGKESFEAQTQKDVAESTRLSKLAAREGMPGVGAVSQSVGALGEATAELVSLGGLLKGSQGFLEGVNLLKAGSTTAKSLNMANRMLKGGPTFAIYEGLHDEKGLAHSFIDGTFLKGLAEGRLWSFASSGKVISRILKGGVIGAGLGAAHEEKGKGPAGALVGGLTGAAFGLLPGEAAERVSAKDEATKRALTPDASKPLNPEVDKTLAANAVQSAQKAARENKPPEININEDLRGVSVRLSMPTGELQEIRVHHYAERSALDLVQKLTMAGGKVEGIDYSTTHGDVLNRFLKMQEAVGVSSKKVDQAILEESKKPEITLPKEEPSKLDQQFNSLSEAKRIVSTHKNLPKSSSLYPALVEAKKTGRDVISRIGDALTIASNRIGETSAERKFIKNHLVDLVNNQMLPSENARINSQLRILAYRPELREFIPPSFREEFDTAVLQSPKGQKFETSFFNYKDAYKILAPLSPRRTPDELMAMAKIYTEIKEGAPDVKANVSGIQETLDSRMGRLRTYNESYAASLAYPEIGEALPTNQKVAWGAARQNYLEAKATRVARDEKAALSKPENTLPVVVDPKVRELRAKWEANKWNDEEAKRRYTEEGGRDVLYEQNAGPANRQAPDTSFELPDLEELEPSEIDQVMQEEISSKSRGIEAPGVMEEFLRTGQWTKEGYGRKVLSAVIKLPPAEDTSKLTMGQNARIEDGVLKVFVPQHVIDREYNMAGAFYEPDRILGVLDNLGFKDQPEEIMNYALQGMRRVDPLNGNLLAGPGNGLIVLPAENPVEHEFHELMHHAMDHISGLSGYFPEHFGLSDSSSKAMGSIQKELSKFEAYETHSQGVMNEEAFVHAATAVIKGDKQVLYGMGMVDTSVSKVVAMVNEVANRSLTKLRSRPDWQELRYVKNRLEAVEGASSPLKSYSLRNAADKLSKNFYADGEGNIVFTSDTGTHTFRDRSEAFQHLLMEDTSAEAPSFTSVLEQMGVLTDSPTLARFSPSKSPVMFEPSLKARLWEGFAAAVDYIQPMTAFIGSAQDMLDKHFQGSQRLPLLEKVKAVDQAFHDNSAWVDKQRKDFGNILKKFSSKQLYDVFNFISVDPKSWPRMKESYNMSDADMEGIKGIYDKLRTLDADQHLGIFNYFLNDLPQLRANNFKSDLVYRELKDPSKMATMQRGVISGRLKPQDTHAGRFVNFVLGASREKLLEKPIAELNQVINLKNKEGKYVLGALQSSFTRWADYMQFHNGESQRMIKDVSAYLQDNILEQFRRINKFMPEGIKLPEEGFEYPSSLLNKAMTISYAADVGLRASAAIRDTIQPYLTSLPIIGPKALARGMKIAFTEHGYNSARDAGALLHGANTSELYGDIYSELPVGGKGIVDRGVETAGKLLAPSRWGHNVGRLFVYHGVNEVTKESIDKLRVGKITPDKFVNDTGIWFLNKSERSRYLTQAMDKGNDRTELAKRISLDMVDRTLWAYRRGQQPGLLRTGVGRVFGQYGYWPMNFASYLQTIGARALEQSGIGFSAGVGKTIKSFREGDMTGGLKQGLRTTKDLARNTVSSRAIHAAGMWLGVNLATYELFDKQFGIDAGKWLFFSPVGFMGGPAVGATLNAFPAAGQAASIAIGQEGTPEGQKALHEEIKMPLHLLPGSNWSQSVLGTIDDPQYWNSDNTPTGKGWIKLLGFRPVDEKERQLEDQRSFEQQLRKRAGFKPGAGNIFGNP